MQQKITVALGATQCVACVSAAASDAIKVPSSVPYADANDIAGNVKRECPINQQLSDYISAAISRHGRSCRSTAPSSAIWSSHSKRRCACMGLPLSERCKRDPSRDGVFCRDCAAPTTAWLV